MWPQHSGLMIKASLLAFLEGFMPFESMVSVLEHLYQNMQALKRGSQSTKFIQLRLKSYAS